MRSYNPDDDRQPAYTPAFVVIATGCLVELAGLALDVYLHERGNALDGERLLTLENPGHVLAMLGVGLIVAGLL